VPVLIIDKKYRLLFLFILIISFVAVFCVISMSSSKDSAIYPVDAVLNLENWEPSKNETLSLSGQWNFYWERFLSPQEATTAVQTPDLTVNIPSVWNRYILDGKNLPGYGYGTYLIKVVNAPSNKQLSLRIPTFSTAYELYIDDRLVASNGTVASDSEQHNAHYNPQIVTFTPDHTSFDIIIHISNFTYARGGMWYAIEMGTPEQIMKIDRTITYKDLFLIGALTVMTLYYLLIYLLRREDKSSLYYVLMCIIFAARTAIYGNFFIYSLLPHIGFKTIITIDYITLCCFSISAAFMIGELFPNENRKLILRIFFSYALIMTLLFILTPVSFFTQTVYFVQFMAILTGAYPIYTLISAYFRGKKDAGTLLCGSLVVILCAVHDVLYQNNIILSSIGELVPLGLFILLFLQAFVLARRFSEAFEDVKTLSQKLLTLDKIKDEFIANTSHELRTPLSGILGISGAMLKGSDGELNERQRQNLSIIESSSRRLANLVNDILDFSKIKNGDIQLNIHPIRIRGIIITIADVFKQLNLSKDLDVIVDLAEDLPPVNADENRVAQILYNLIGNAVKFTKNGSVTVSAEENGSMLEFCIRDTGIGIPVDKLEDIFHSFEQVDSSLTRAHGGTGLGLPITKRLVELQGGAIRVESREGNGSKFYFTLPLAGSDAPEQEIIPSLPKFKIPSLEEIRSNLEAKGDPHILLVDDDPVNLQAASSILRTEGYGITVANSGKDALVILESASDFSLVVLDIMMPEMSGYEVCKKLRERKSPLELPVLMLTAKASTEDLITGFQAGANDYLTKPYAPEELLARAKTLTGLKVSADKALAAETAFMQAQIKPHFLFNTLNTISYFCDIDPVFAQQLIDDFANFLRQSFDFKNIETSISLESELGTVASYIKIEKARFGEKLQILFDIDRLQDVRVPFLSIQPLVENAVNHGLRKKGGYGTVSVSIKNVPEGVRISVEDNGQGIEPDKLAKLLLPESSRGIGLWNIDSRLKKIFGTGLFIESTPGQGTCVSYLIPLEVIE
jgi:signal transduction histidine kinase